MYWPVKEILFSVYPCQGLSQELSLDKFLMKTKDLLQQIHEEKGKKTYDKLMIFEAKLQEIKLIIRIILLHIIHLGLKCFNFPSVEPLEYGCQFVICLDSDF